MPKKVKREVPRHIQEQRDYRTRAKESVRRAELERWKQNGGGKPAVLPGKSKNRMLTPEEYEAAFGRPMPEVLLHQTVTPSR